MVPLVAVAGAALASLLLAACASPTGASPTELRVLAAASLRDVVEDAAAAYPSAASGVRLVGAFDASSALRVHVEQGAPADVFLSADLEQPRRLVAAGLADGRPVIFAANRLAIIVPAGRPTLVSNPADLGRPGVRIVAAGREVPITRYAERLVANLARLPGFPPDLPARYDANVATREDSVRAVLAKVALGEGDAGIVYVSDARASDAVRRIEVPAEANVAAAYAGVVVATAAHPAEAAAFLRWLASPDGLEILRERGFEAPS